MEKLERREQGLRARWELQEGRLGREGGGRSGFAGGAAAAGGRVLGAREEMKALQLRQKKERLGYAVERLQLQAQQTERKLRMSMAAQEQQQQRMSRGGRGNEGDEDELA